MDGIYMDIHMSDRNGKVFRYASRRWAQVPRIGERVELQKPGDDSYHLAEVIMVHWGEDTITRDQRVALIVKWVKGAKQ